MNSISRKWTFAEPPAGTALWFGGWLGAALLASSSWGLAADDTDPQQLLAQEVEEASALLEQAKLLENQWRTAAESKRNESRSRLREILALERDLADQGDAGSRSKAERTLDRSHLLFEEALEGVDRALLAFEQPSGIPREIRVHSSHRRRQRSEGMFDLGELAARLDEVESELESSVEGLEILERDLRDEQLDRALAVLAESNQLRLAAIRALPFDQRVQLSSFSPASRTEIALELRGLRMVVRLQWHRASNFLTRGDQWLKSLYSTLTTGGNILEILLIVLVWRWAQRSRREHISKLQERADKTRDRQLRENNRLGVEFVGALAPWGIFASFVTALIWILGEEARSVPLVIPALLLMLVYALYRLVVDVVFLALVVMARNAELSIAPELLPRIRLSLRRVMGSATVLTAVVVIVQFRLGQGVLFQLGRDLSFAVFAVALMISVVKWRRHLAEAYLAMKAEGRLAELVRSCEGKAKLAVVAPICFFWLLGRGLMTLVELVAQRFEGTRHAKVFLTRRRMERAAAVHGYAQGRVQDLPAELIQAFEPGLTRGDVENHLEDESIERVSGSLASWEAGQTSASVLLAGERGLGKRAIVDHLVGDSTKVDRIRPAGRILSASDLREWLARELFPGLEMDPDHLEDRLLAGPRRVVILEHAENLFVTTVNGYHSLAEIGPLVDATRKKVFWLLSMAGLAWNHLNAAGKSLAFLRHRIVLAPWSERQLMELIRDRLSTHGFEVSFAELLGKGSRREDRRSREREGLRAYSNLLWHFSGGNPVVALHYFLRSLEVGTDGSLVVRPFLQPAENDLIDLGQEALFITASVARHGRVTAEEAALASDFDVEVVRERLVRLVDVGVLGHREAHFWVSIPWLSTTLNVLRRLNILVS